MKENKRLAEITETNVYEHLTPQDIRYLYNTYQAIINETYSMTIGEYGVLRQSILGGTDWVPGWLIDLVMYSLGGTGG